ncbi:MAG TPA: hypothetical protein PKC49_15035 [Phycisphaerae bacterium]|nr:hypothetical protein [Phycisphaerae bacterium]
MAHDPNRTETTTPAGDSRRGTGPGGGTRIIAAAELRAMMLERVTPDDIAAVVEAPVSRAKAGDTAATKVLFDRVFGRIADHDPAAAGERADGEVHKTAAI